jgi:hypothetical protein
MVMGFPDGLRVALARAAASGGDLGFLALLSWLYEIAFRVAIVMADPGHGEGQVVFVAALGDELEEVIRAD